jgi:hypothetical protein
MDDFPTPLSPAYWQSGYERSIALYDGPVVLSCGDETAALEGFIEFRWRAKPSVRWTAGLVDDDGDWPRFLDDASDFDATVDKAAAEEALLSQPSSTERRFRRSKSGSLRPYVAGAVDAPIRSAVFNLVNFSDLPGVERIGTTSDWRLARNILTVDDWRLVLDRTADAPFDELKQTGGYAFTHVCALERKDGEPFVWSDASRVREAVFHGLSFAHGALVGHALPVGLDNEGTRQWAEWSVTIADGWHNHFSWCADLASLDPVVQGLAQGYSDDLWREATNRAIRYYVDANRPEPVDVTLGIAGTGLEILEWAILLEIEGWLTLEADEKLSSADRLRLLLKWANISTDLPTTLPNLTRVAAEKRFDGPATAMWARNRTVHPPKRRRQDWLRSDAIVEAWRLLTWYLELVILRMVGYQGQYVSRVAERPSMFALESVPWSASNP